MVNVSGLLNFRRVRAGLDTRPFTSEISAAEALWGANTRRQTHIRVQRETNTIFLREADRVGESEKEVREIQGSVETPYTSSFPATMHFLAEVSATLDASLQRAMLVRLYPGGQVFPHVDRGSYYALRDRYHLVIVSPTGSILRSGDEAVTMHEGELWWFNNKLRHEAENRGVDWRVHLIFDLLPRS
jgi:hypothetical protein